MGREWDYFLVFDERIPKRRPFSESPINTSKRRRRVSGFFAEITQKLAVRLYQGACPLKNSQALGLALNCRSDCASSFRSSFSNEYFPDFRSRRLCASRPGGA